MSNIKVSVIIPVYNVENYLKECLDSIINQTLKDIEILCVNDCSTDSSLDIIEDYCKKDNRVKLIQHETNKGLGAARNTALNYVNGEYLLFIDSDDWLHLETCETTYNHAKKHDLDVVMYRLINYDEDTGNYRTTGYYDIVVLNDFQYKIFSYNDLDDFFSMPVSACNKLYKTKLIKEKNIRFPEQFKMFEDNPFFFNILINSEKMSFIPKHFYYRRVRSNSIMTNKTNLSDIIGIYNEVLLTFHENNLFLEYKNLLFNKKVEIVKMWFDSSADSYKPHFFEEIKKDFQRIKKDTNGIYKTFEEELTAEYQIFFKIVLNSSTFNEYKLNYIINEHEQKYDKLTRENEALQTDYNELKKENNNLLMFKEKTIPQISKLINNISMINENTINDLKIAENILTEKEPSNNKLNFQLNILENNLIEKENEITELHNQTFKLERIIKTNTILIANLEHENKFLNKKIEKIQQKDNGKITARISKKINNIIH